MARDNYLFEGQFQTKIFASIAFPLAFFGWLLMALLAQQRPNGRLPF
jgi:hypothetical protein